MLEKDKKIDTWVITFNTEKLFPVIIEVISVGNEETLRTLCDPPTYSWWRQLRNHCILKREICYGDV